MVNRENTASQPQPHSRHTSAPHHQTHSHPHTGWTRVTAAIAAGKRPDPSRTRKLSQPAPMILPNPGGKVGHRRTQFTETPPEKSGGVSHSQSKSVKFAGLRLFSNASSVRLRSIPPPYPVNPPVEPITRWHGTMMPMGFRPFANPTARDAPGEPICSAISPYDRVSP